MSLHPSWKPILNHEFAQPYFRQLSEFLSEAYATKTIFPRKTQVFSAFSTDPTSIRVVILGQDPYHTPGVAHGLAFSVENRVAPPSLVNIYKEIESDTGKSPADKSGNLQHWADQGVFLLNDVLTVEAHKAASHRGKGWEIFTENIVKHLSATAPHLVFILWGRNARAKKTLINTAKHKILEAPHPSPLSAHSGFFGSKPFSQTNAQLKTWGYPEITW